MTIGFVQPPAMDRRLRHRRRRAKLSKMPSPPSSKLVDRAVVVSSTWLGLLRQPKWGHLSDLHRAVKLCEPALVSGDPTVTPLGNYQEAHVFKLESGACAAFLANYNHRSFAKVSFGNMHYNLPPWSITILPDCKNTVYNTASMKMPCVPVHGGFSWQAYTYLYKFRYCLWKFRNPKTNI